MNACKEDGCRPYLAPLCRWFCGTLLLILAVGIAAPIHAQQRNDAPQAYGIAAGKLADALDQLARQSKVQIIYPSDLVRGKTAPAVSGPQTWREALQKLLAGSGLEWGFVNDTTVVIRQSSEAAKPAKAQSTPPSHKQAAKQKVTELEQVVVTGSQIVGVHDIASPLQIYTREDIAQTGAGSVQRFIQTLPQNFQGGAWEGTVFNYAGGGTTDNRTQGTGVNLRGLGNDSTLVLLNGHRIAPSDVGGGFVDVSLIPATALDRVEVMPDGASALYGSDAVGGVVNFITRRDYQGAETRIRYGGVTEGNLDEYQFAQTLGKTWSGGSALLSYEYLQQSPLNLNDKSWVRDKSPWSFTLLPEQKRHALFASANQLVGDNVELFGDATYANRRTPEYWFSNPYSVSNYQANVNSWSVDGGVRVELPNDYQFETSASYAAGDTRAKTIELGQGMLGSQHVETRAFSWDTKLSGSLFHLPAGTVQFTAGADYQMESYSNVHQPNSKASYDGNRQIWAGFTEVRMPLAGTVGSLPKLEMSLAGRYEHYSDFGSTANPKVGLIWRSTKGLKFRGTWGKSFVAPLLSQMDPIPLQVAALLISDPLADPSGTSVPGIFIFGGNPDLRPQKATTWTLGFDWTSQGLPGLRANATYYDIDYTDRITSPQLAFAGAANTGNPLAYPNLLGPFITRSPTLEEVQRLVDTTAEFDDFTGIPGGVDLSTIAALVDYRNANLSAVRTSGVDFGASYLWHPGAASMEIGIDGTYILKLDNLLATGVPVVEAADTVFNPADLKLRARWTFDAGPFNGALFVNYVDSYRDTRSNPSVPIASWTTTDAQLGYRFDRPAGVLAGTSLTLGVINLFDRAPPYVAPSYSTIPGYSSLDFDGANADVRGRFIYVQAIKKF
jgi:outer membrane receptor protein involved in Fe transport